MAKKPSNPVKTNRAERNYESQLRKLARQIGEIVQTFEPITPDNVSALMAMLRQYADVLTPWATATASKMLEEVNQRSLAGWREMTAEMSAELRREILNAPTGEAQRKLLAEQVNLIKSLPIEAAQRVHELTLQGIEDSSRAAQLAQMIRQTSQVTSSRASLIARTEVARTASTLTQARAKHVGSPGYIWMTSRDGDVRPSHREMAGKFVAWDNPPTLDNLTGHAGCLPNCRCYPKPVLEE